MSEQTQDPNSVAAEEVIDNLSSRIGVLSKENAIHEAKNNNLVRIIEQAQDVIRQLQDQVEALTKLTEEKPANRAQRRSAPKAKAEAEEIPGELVEDQA